MLAHHSFAERAGQVLIAAMALGIVISLVILTGVAAVFVIGIWLVPILSELGH